MTDSYQMRDDVELALRNAFNALSAAYSDLEAANYPHIFELYLTREGLESILHDGKADSVSEMGKLIEKNQFRIELDLSRAKRAEEGDAIEYLETALSEVIDAKRSVGSREWNEHPEPENTP